MNEVTYVALASQQCSRLLLGKFISNFGSIPWEEHNVGSGRFLSAVGATARGRGGVRCSRREEDPTTSESYQSVLLELSHSSIFMVASTNTYYNNVIPVWWRAKDPQCHYPHLSVVVVRADWRRKLSMQRNTYKNQPVWLAWYNNPKLPFCLCSSSRVLKKKYHVSFKTSILFYLLSFLSRLLKWLTSIVFYSSCV